MTIWTTTTIDNDNNDHTVNDNHTVINIIVDDKDDNNCNNDEHVNDNYNNHIHTDTTPW